MPMLETPEATVSGAPERVQTGAETLPIVSDPRFATSVVLVAWCLLGVGDSAREGEYSGWGLALMVVGFVALLGVIGARLPLGRPNRWQLAGPAVVALAAAELHPVHRYMHADGGVYAIDALAAATAALAVATLWLKRDSISWAAVALLALATGVTTIVSASDPRIDVWYLLQQSSTGLLHGLDMYRQHWQHSTGLQAVYPYLPSTTLVLAPFKWLLGDVRYGLLLASLLTSWQLRRIAPAAPAALALLVLVSPHWAFLIDQSWTEPLLLALLTAAFVSIQLGRPTLAIVGLGVALAAKQHIVLLLPLFALWPAFGFRRTAKAAALALAIALPWLIAGPHDMWHDAVHANLSLGVIPRALSLPSMLLRHDITVGFWFTLLGLALVYAVTLLRAPRTVAALALSCAAVLWAVDLANKQSFFNHYQLPLGLLVVAIACASGDRAVPRVAT
jgi:hypothetical protein